MYLQYFNKKTESLPLDWILTKSFKVILDLFNNRFQDFISNPNLLITQKNLPDSTHLNGG